MRVRRMFSLVFVAGGTALACAVGLSLMTLGVFFSSQPLLVALRYFGIGHMAAGLTLWITGCRECANKPEFNYPLDFTLGIGSVLLTASLVLYNTRIAPIIGPAGAVANVTALVFGLSVMVVDPAYPCSFATNWPQGGDCRDPHVPATELRHPQGHAVEPEMLSVIRGIDHGLELVLNEAGIVTYLDVGDHSVQHLRAILREYHAPIPAEIESWPRQAKLAATGKWEDLERLKNRLEKVNAGV